MLVCGLPLPRYITETCCADDSHIDNFMDEDYEAIFHEVVDMAKSCLEAIFPGAILFEPLGAFGGDEDTNLKELLSSGGLSIWCLVIRSNTHKQQRRFGRSTCKKAGRQNHC